MIIALTIAFNTLLGLCLIGARRALWPWITGPVAFTVLVLGNAGAIVYATGSPRAVSIAMPSAEAEVLAYTFQENVAFWLWVRPDGTLKPVYIELPWNPESAEKMIQQIEGKVEGGTLTVQPDTLYRDWQEGEPHAHPLPPVAMPPKNGG